MVKEAAKRSNFQLVSENASQHIKNSCNIWWIDIAAVHEYISALKPWQRINHFPGMTNIARKGRMAQNLDFMRKRVSMTGKKG